MFGVSEFRKQTASSLTLIEAHRKSEIISAQRAIYQLKYKDYLKYKS